MPAQRGLAWRRGCRWYPRGGGATVVPRRAGSGAVVGRGDGGTHAEARAEGAGRGRSSGLRLT